MTVTPLPSALLPQRNKNLERPQHPHQILLPWGPRRHDASHSHNRFHWGITQQLPHMRMCLQGDPNVSQKFKSTMPHLEMVRLNLGPVLIKPEEKVLAVLPQHHRALWLSILLCPQFLLHTSSYLGSTYFILWNDDLGESLEIPQNQEQALSDPQKKNAKGKRILSKFSHLLLFKSM